MCIQVALVTPESAWWRSGVTSSEVVTSPGLCLPASGGPEIMLLGRVPQVSDLLLLCGSVVLALMGQLRGGRGGRSACVEAKV